MIDLQAHSTFVYRSLGCDVPDRKTPPSASSRYLSLAGAATAAVHSSMQPFPNLPLPLP